MVLDFFYFAHRLLPVKLKLFPWNLYHQFSTPTDIKLLKNAVRMEKGMEAFPVTRPISSGPSLVFSLGLKTGAGIDSWMDIRRPGQAQPWWWYTPFKSLLLAPGLYPQHHSVRHRHYRLWDARRRARQKAANQNKSTLPLPRGEELSKEILKIQLNIRLQAKIISIRVLHF